MVALDRDRGAAGEGYAFDHVRIERALRQEFRRATTIARNLLGFRFEDIDEEFADCLALGFRIAHAIKRAEEHIARINMHERDVVSVAEQRDDFLRLAHAHQAVIDEDASQAIANRFMDEHGSNSGVDTTRQTAQDTTIADLIADGLDRLATESGHGPIALQASDLMHEVGDELGTVWRMHNFEMELHGVIAALFISDGRERRIL